MRDDAETAGKDRCMEERYGWVWPSREAWGRDERGRGESKGVPYSQAFINPCAAGNKIGDPGVKYLSLALAKCPNLCTLNLSGQ